MNRPLVERGGEREKCFPFPFLAIFSPHRELVHRIAWEANPSRVMKKKFLKKKFLVGRGYPEGKMVQTCEVVLYKTQKST